MRFPQREKQSLEETKNPGHDTRAVRQVTQNY